jgi:hypothetical protein
LTKLPAALVLFAVCAVMVVELPIVGTGVEREEMWLLEPEPQLARPTASRKTAKNCVLRIIPRQRKGFCFDILGSVRNAMLRWDFRNQSGLSGMGSGYCCIEFRPRYQKYINPPPKAATRAASAALTQRAFLKRIPFATNKEQNALLSSISGADRVRHFRLLARSH